MMVKKLFRIYIPLLDNTGKRFNRRYFDAVRDELVTRFSGVTCMKSSRDGALNGYWIDEATGRLFRDEIIIYYVAADPTPETDAFFSE